MALTTRIRHIFLLFMVGIAPLIMMLAMTFVVLDASPNDYVPDTWNDQIAYWRYIATFSKVGFQGGYYSRDEKQALIPEISFGIHGPVFPMIYGTLAKLTGWYNSTSIWFNVIFLGLGSVGCALLCRMRGWQLVALALVTSTLWVIPIHAIYTSQESLHQTFALLLAGLFYRLFEAQQQNAAPQRWIVIACTVLLVVASLMRISWSLLYAPFFVLLLRPQRLFSWFIAIVLTLIFVGGSYLLYTVIITTPDGSSIINTLAKTEGNPLKLLEVLYKTIRGWRYWLIYPFSEPAQMFVYLGTLTFFGLGLLIWIVQRLTKRSTIGLNVPVASFHVYNLMTLFLLALVLYLPNGFFRVFGVHILLSIGLLIAYKQRLLIAIILVVNLMFAGAAVESVRYRQQNDFVIPPTQLDSYRAEMAQYIQVSALTENRWCNTMFVDAPFFDVHWLTIPYEFGVTMTLESDFVRRIQSRYLYVADVPNIPNRLERIADLSFGGTLYENLDAPCE